MMTCVTCLYNWARSLTYTLQTWGWRQYVPLMCRVSDYKPAWHQIPEDHSLNIIRSVCYRCEREECELCLRTGCWKEYLYVRERKKEEATKKLLNEALHNLYLSLNVSGEAKQNGWVVIQETRNLYEILVGKPERKRSVGIWQHR
jgi:hypothetical protein